MERFYGPPTLETFYVATSTAYKHAYTIGRLTSGEFAPVYCPPNLDKLFEQRRTEIINVLHSTKYADDDGENVEQTFSIPQDFEANLKMFIAYHGRPVFVAEIAERFFGGRIPPQEFIELFNTLNKISRAGGLIRHGQGYFSTPNIWDLSGGETIGTEPSGKSGNAPPLDKILKSSGLYKKPEEPAISRHRL